ncbi:hypothetical protein HDU91_004506, partial [Kappamyces sp. JEL0680]
MLQDHDQMVSNLKKEEERIGNEYKLAIHAGNTLLGQLNGQLDNIDHWEEQFGAVLKHPLSLLWAKLSGTGVFHHVWLRDNCPCPLCLHPINRQKLHSSGQVSPLATVQSVQVGQTSLAIEWKGGHKSQYSLDWLEKNRYDREKGPLVKHVTWDAASYARQRETVAFHDFQSERGFSLALRQLRDFGLAFLKNVPVDDHRMNSFYGTSWDVKNDPNSKNIAYTSLFLGLHMDLLYFEAPPGLQLLHCLENTVDGGTSLFHDVFGSVERFRADHPKEFEILCRVPVTFHYDNDGKHFEYTRPTINLDRNDTYHIYYSPPFQGPLRANPKDVPGFYSAFALFESYLQDKAYQYEYRMQPGDCVLFANRRVLHARDAFDPASGHRWFKGTYVEWDSVKDRIRVGKPAR